MHLQRIRFDRVFDVVRHTGAFSFESDGKRTYGVVLPQRMIPKDGDVVLIAFDKPGDFSTVLGWRKPQSDRVVIESGSLQDIIHSAGLAYSVSAIVLASGLSFFGKSGLLAAALAAAVWLAVWIVQRRRSIHRVLQDNRPIQAG